MGALSHDCTTGPRPGTAPGAVPVCCMSQDVTVECALQEMERLVCGNPNLDFEALQQNSQYEGGFSAATEVSPNTPVGNSTNLTGPDRPT
jgi:hypothetical protein